MKNIRGPEINRNRKNRLLGNYKYLNYVLDNHFILELCILNSTQNVNYIQDDG